MSTSLPTSRGSDGLAFSAQSKQRIADYVRRYPVKKGALIPVLWVAQEQFGWLQPGVIELVAAELGLPVAEVLATSMFYTMFRKRPHGRYHLQVCTNVSCYLRGSDALVEVCEQELGIHPGQTTPDGLFTLEEVQCLCACDRAPCLQVNHDDHFKVEPSQLREMIINLRQAGQRLGPDVGWDAAAASGHSAHDHAGHDGHEQHGH